MNTSNSKQIIFETKRTPSILKGHGNEPVFPTFLHKSVADSAYQWYGESLFEKKISLSSIFWTLSSRVGEYFVHAVGFYLNLAIFATWKSFQHGLINYIDTKAKCCNLKNWLVKGLCGRCLFVWGPPYTLAPLTCQLAKRKKSRP